jgi:hypothetical protein
MAILEHKPENYIMILGATIVLVYCSVMYFAWGRQEKQDELNEKSRIKLIESVNIGAYHYEIVKIDSSEFLVNSHGLVKIK